MRSVAELVRTPSVPGRGGRTTPTLASVNLLSPAMLEHIAVTRMRKRFLAGALAVAVLVAAGWMAQTRELHAAERQLAAEAAATPRLRTQLQSLDRVAEFFAAVAQRKQMASSAMAAEVLFSSALNDLQDRTPQGLQIRTMSVTLTPEVVADTAGSAVQEPEQAQAQTQTQTQDVNCPRPDPFSPAAVIGCVSLTGTAPTRGVVAALIHDLKASSLYADPFITTTSYGQALGDQAVQFAGTVGLTREAVSSRYSDPRWLADPRVLARAYRLVESGRAAAVRLARQATAAAPVGDTIGGPGR